MVVRMEAGTILAQAKLALVLSRQGGRRSWREHQYLPVRVPKYTAGADGHY